MRIETIKKPKIEVDHSRLNEELLQPEKLRIFLNEQLNGECDSVIQRAERNDEDSLQRIKEVLSWNGIDFLTEKIFKILSQNKKENNQKESKVIYNEDEIKRKGYSKEFIENMT